MDFRQYLNSKFDFNIIKVNTDNHLPPYPFATYQTINENRDTNHSFIRDELSLDKTEITESKTKRIEEVIQLDVYGTSIESMNSTMRSLIDGIEFVYREDLLLQGFGIINIGSIVDNTSIELTESRYRKTVEITIDYNDTIERTVANIDKVTWGTTDDENSEITERGE